MFCETRCLHSCCVFLSCRCRRSHFDDKGKTRENKGGERNIPWALCLSSDQFVTVWLCHDPDNLRPAIPLRGQPAGREARSESFKVTSLHNDKILQAFDGPNSGINPYLLKFLSHSYCFRSAANIVKKKVIFKRTTVLCRIKQWICVGKNDISTCETQSVCHFLFS